MIRDDFSKYCALVAIFLLSWMNSTSAQISQQEARADIDELVSAPHGFTAPSGADILALVEKVKNNPESYLAIIRQDLFLPVDKDSLVDSDFLHYYGTLTAILMEIGNQEARELLRQAYFDTADRLDSLRSKLSVAEQSSAPPEEIYLIDNAIGSIIFLQGDIISELRDLKDESILMNCLDRVESESQTTLHIIMLNYVEDVGIGDTAVRSRLEETFLDVNSPLYNDPDLKITLILLGSQLFVPPSLTSLDPDTVTAGSEDFTLAVVGANFFSGATVHWNSTPRNTTFISTMQLQAVIPATDIDSVGTASVTAKNPVGTTSNSLTLTIIEASPVSDLSSIATLATHSIWLEQNSEILSGSVVVNESGNPPFLDSEVALSAGIGVSVAAGCDLKANSIKVKQNATVAGNVYYNELTNNGAITGALHTPLSLPVLPTLPPFQTAAPGTEDLTLAQNEERTLAPGNYGDILVRMGGKLIFTGGIYNLRSLNCGDNTALVFRAASEVRIAEKFETGQGSSLGPEAGTAVRAGDIVFHVAGINGTSGNLGATPKAAKIGLSNTVFANFYVPNGTLWLRQGSVVEGAFIGRDVNVGIGVRVTLNSAW